MSKYNFKQLHDLLARWGKDSHSLPANNDALKQKALDALQPSQENWAEVVTPRRHRGFWRISFASLAGVYAVYLIISPYAFNFLANSNDPMPYYAYPQVTGGAASDVIVNDLGLEYAKTTGLGASQPSSLPRFAPDMGYYYGNPDVSDTREFLKVGYHATIKTRQVEKLGNQIQTMIRGYGGRIDYSSFSSRYGSISFVMPKSALDAFENEVDGLAPARFLEKTITNQNLLPQKQSVENQTGNAQSQLDDYQAKKAQLTKDHNSTVASLNKQINSLTYSINEWSQEVTTDTARQAVIDKQIASLTASRNSLRNQLNSENTLYQRNLSHYDSNISNLESYLDNLAGQDRGITDQVETVQGSISLTWISVVQMINLYVPVRYLVVGLLAVLVFILLRGRKQDEFVLP